MLIKEICKKCNNNRCGNCNSDEDFEETWTSNNEVWCVGLCDNGYGYVSTFMDIENLPCCPFYLEQTMRQ